jgi:NADH-quinone oxidoreductase subunit L
VVIKATHRHDLFELGGLRKELPLAFWTFLVGSLALTGLPFVTAGFYSKDMILWQAWSSPGGGAVLWAAGLLGAFITSLYTFRMVFVTFFGATKMDVSHRPGARMTAPLTILAVLSIIGGFIELPETLGHMNLFSDFLSPVFPDPAVHHADAGSELLFQVIASLVSLSGIAFAYFLYLRRPQMAEKLAQAPVGAGLQRFWFSGWGFDGLYDTFFVRPFEWIARINKDDVIDSGYTGIARLNLIVHGVLSKTQTGSIRWYAMGIAFGAVVFLGMIVFVK